ncbi:MAG: type IV secretory system conjugative DNA transfer family protein [Nitrosomonas sp.]|nr:type IV secretory system conjugative DNA transfer family protein [Nitrosomonas sp.]
MGNKWYGEYSGIFDLAAGFGILFSSIGLILVPLKWYWPRHQEPQSGIAVVFSQSADKQDIAAAGLLAHSQESQSNPERCRLCRRAGGIIPANPLSETHGPEHVLCYAPTRSGKESQLGHTYRFWIQSAVITDPGQQLWAQPDGGATCQKQGAAFLTRINQRALESAG